MMEQHINLALYDDDGDLFVYERTVEVPFDLDHPYHEQLRDRLVTLTEVLDAFVDALPPCPEEDE